MTKPKRYDYAEAIARYCDGCGDAADFKRILRKLVRESIRAWEAEHYADADDVERIAKDLVP